MWQTLIDNFHSLSQKMWIISNDNKYRQIIYHRAAYEEMNWFVLFFSLGDDLGRRNGHLKHGSQVHLSPVIFTVIHRWPRSGSWSSSHEESDHATYMLEVGLTPLETVTKHHALHGLHAPYNVAMVASGYPPTWVSWIRDPVACWS